MVMDVCGCLYFCEYCILRFQDGLLCPISLLKVCIDSHLLSALRCIDVCVASVWWVSRLLMPHLHLINLSSAICPSWSANPLMSGTASENCKAERPFCFEVFKKEIWAKFKFLSTSLAGLGWHEVKDVLIGERNLSILRHGWFVLADASTENGRLFWTGEKQRAKIWLVEYAEFLPAKQNQHLKNLPGCCLES